MIAVLRTGLLIAALALLLGVVFAAWQGDAARALLYLGLAATCGTFERIAALGGRKPPGDE